MTTITDATPFKAQRGDHVAVMTISTGPIVLEVSRNKGVSFQNIDSGSFAASIDKVITLGDDLIYRAQIPGGDFLTITPADTSISTDPQDV
jgi:hypothetical protein